MVLEEGFLLDDLRRVLQSVAEAAQQSGVRIVTGDTKVVPSGKGGGIFINTSGIAERVFPYPLTPQNIRSGDSVLVSGPLGAHGITILASRESLRVGEHLQSDCAFLFPLCESLFSLERDIRFLRDATRGGLAAVLNEAASDTDFGIRIDENSLPIQEDVSYVSEILGLSPVEIANEGVLVAIVSSARTDEALDLLMSHSLGKQAAVIGEVLTSNPGRVVLETAIGGHRIMDFPRGLILPRIC
jgi:hydrogenase expression/formation protein HypE